MKALFVLFLLLFFSNTFAKTIKIVFFNDYEPISFSTPVDEHAIGVIPSIIEEALDEITVNDPNTKIELIGLPWIRAQDMVRTGDADAMVTIATPERLTYSTPSKMEVFQDAYRAFTYPGHPRMEELKRIKSLDDLHDFTVCEYRVNGWAKTNLTGKVKEINYTRDINAKISLLTLHSCDLIIELDFLVFSIAKRYNFLDKIVELPALFKGTSYHLLVSKKSPNQDLLNIFDKKLKAMNEQGRIKTIIQKWVPDIKN